MQGNTGLLFRSKAAYSARERSGAGGAWKRSGEDQMSLRSKQTGLPAIVAVATLVTAAVMAGLTATTVSVQASAAPAGLESDFLRLQTTIESAPADDLRAPGYRTYLLTKTRLAFGDAKAGRMCMAEAQLAQMRQNLSVRSTAGAPSPDGAQVAPVLAAQLEAEILDIEALLLSSGGAGGCGGPAQPASPAPTPLIKVSSSDNMQITFHVTFPTPTFAGRLGNGVPYLEMFGPNMGDVSSLFLPSSGSIRQPGGGAVGRPELPATGTVLAIPQGGGASVHLVATSNYRLPGVELWPFQPEAPAPAVNTALLPPPPAPFTIDATAYGSTQPYPSRLAIAAPVGSLHGLEVDTVALAGAQYVPARQSLTVLTGMDVQVIYGGSTANVFGTTHLISPANIPYRTLWQGELLNWATVSHYLAGVSVGLLCGEEMMVITSPALASVANQFAAARTSDGIITRTFLTGGGPSQIGTTAQQIRDAIAQQYNDTKCWVNPSYVLLLGDATVVPTFEISMGLHADKSSSTGFSPNFYEDPVATDVPYGFIHQSSQVDSSLKDGTDDITDYGQDLFVGRVTMPLVAGIAGDPDVDAATAEMTMIENYEARPPFGPSFYNNVTGAEFFQPCPAVGNDCGNSANPPAPVTPSTQDLESFLRSSEFVGTEAQVAGKTFNRIASDEQDNDSKVTINPQTFDDGTSLPSGINWSGSTTDITNRVNAGTFLLWHSDHGYTDGSGWYEPAFGVGDVNSASPPSGLLPVVWSSDCDTGKFDANSGVSTTYMTAGTTPAYAPEWLESLHGVGAVGASRESPIYEDGFMLKGMGTNLFPEEGNIWRALLGIAPASPVVELGQLLEAAKNYMSSETAADLTTDTGAQGTNLEYNDFGDPSMAIWRSAPRIYSKLLTTVSGTVLQISTAQQGTDGTLVNVMLNGQLIGQGELVDGSAQITVTQDMSGFSGATIDFSRDGFVSSSINLSPPPPQ
jgi:peptidase C25-like protein